VISTKVTALHVLNILMKNDCALRQAKVPQGSTAAHEVAGCGVIILWLSVLAGPAKTGGFGDQKEASLPCLLRGEAASAYQSP
jgi:hypothetical protein